MSQTLSRGSVTVNKKRWAAYAAAGVAATLAGAQSAEAEITWVIVGSPTGDITFDGDFFRSYLGNTAFALSADNNGSSVLVNVIGGSVAGFTASDGIGNYQSYASNLSFGANISTANFGIGNADGILAGNYGYSNSQFINTGGYVAFQFNSGTQFGWARFSVLNGPPSNEYVLEEFAYGMVGEEVKVGQVPEPTSLSLGLLALGAIGVMEHRRRRAAG